MNITNIKITKPANESSNVKAVCTVTYENGLDLKGIRLFQREKDQSFYLMMPAAQYNGHYYPHFSLSDSLKDKMLESVLNEYKKM